MAPSYRPRVMVRWMDARRQVVATVAQGVQANGFGQPVAVYIATVSGLDPEPCPRFQCAVTKVEDALRRLRIRATRVA
jgi:hypothetical protein